MVLFRPNGSAVDYPGLTTVCDRSQNNAYYRDYKKTLEDYLSKFIGLAEGG